MDNKFDSDSANQLTEKEIEITIEQAQKQIERSQKLQRLEQNQDFKDLFLKGYLQEFAVDNVKLRRGFGFWNNEGMRKSNDSKLTGIAEFASYCQSIHALGMQMRQVIEDSKSELEKLHKEMESEQ